MREWHLRTLGVRRREFYWDGDRLAAEVFPSGGLRVYEYGGDGALIPLAITDYASAASEPKSGRRYEVFSDLSLLETRSGRFPSET